MSIFTCFGISLLPYLQQIVIWCGLVMLDKVGRSSLRIGTNMNE